MKRLTQLIHDDMRPALGVTEPGAIAFAVATAKGHITGALKGIRLVLNSGMYKNAFTCGIPNSHEVGNEHAAALGYVAADASKGLECLEGVKPHHNQEAHALVNAGLVKVELGEISSRIYIFAEITTNEGAVNVTIRDAHTHVTRITKDGQTIFERDDADTKDEERQTPFIHRFTLRQMLHYAQSVPIEELLFIRQAYDLNLALFEQALQNRRTTFAHYLYKRTGKELFRMTSRRRLPYSAMPPSRHAYWDFRAQP